MPRRCLRGQIESYPGSTQDSLLQTLLCGGGDAVQGGRMQMCPVCVAWHNTDSEQVLSAHDPLTSL